eukprot:5001601-Amphidinium_carterae.1
MPLPHDTAQHRDKSQWTFTQQQRQEARDFLRGLPGGPAMFGFEAPMGPDGVEEPPALSSVL